MATSQKKLQTSDIETTEVIDRVELSD